MAGEQFHIFIYGGSETVAHGRDFLCEQDAELNRSMNDFMQGCKDEKDAFDQSIDSMGNQCYNSNMLYDEAKNIRWKAEERMHRAEWCINTFQGLVNDAQGYVTQAEDAIRTAESKISTCQDNISDRQWWIDSYQSDIDIAKERIKNSQDELKKHREWLANASSQDSASSEKSRIEHDKYEIERNEDIVAGKQKDIESKRAELKVYQQQLAQAEKMKSAAEKALAAAQTHLQLCQQKLSEAGALKNRAEALVQKAKNSEDTALKAWSADSDKLEELKKTAKKSAQVLEDLADNSLNIQRDACDNLGDNAAIMNKLAELMYDYETYSLDGGKL